jgi:hypothetical protein
MKFLFPIISILVISFVALLPSTANAQMPQVYAVGAMFQSDDATLMYNFNAIESNQPVYQVYNVNVIVDYYENGAPLGGYVDEGINYAEIPVYIPVTIGNYYQQISYYSLRPVDICGGGIDYFGFSICYGGNYFFPYTFEGRCVPVCFPAALIVLGAFLMESQALPRVTIPSHLVGVPRDETAEVDITVSPSPSNTSVTLRLSKTSGDKGEARFSSNNSTTLVISQSTRVSIKGITESDTVDNIKLVAVAGSPERELASRNFSVVWVTLELRTGIDAKVSMDNNKITNYKNFFGRETLGTFLGSGTLTGIWGTAVEIVGKVNPSNYRNLLSLDRVLTEGKIFNDQEEFSAEPPNKPDKSPDALRDDDPQSNDSKGKIYDLDVPGLGFGAPVGRIGRKRGNFRQFATIQVYRNGKLEQIQCSPNLNWYTAISIRKTETGDVLHTQDEVTDDNRAGVGTINVTWNLRPPQP